MESRPHREESVPVLIARAVDEATRRLGGRLEGARQDLREGVKGTALIGAGAGLGLVGAAVLAGAAVSIASSKSTRMVLGAGAALVASGALFAMLGFSQLPKQPVSRAKRQLKEELVAVASGRDRLAPRWTGAPRLGR